MAYKQETETGNGDRGRRSHAFKRALLWVTAVWHKLVRVAGIAAQTAQVNRWFQHGGLLFAGGDGNQLLAVCRASGRFVTCNESALRNA